MSIKHHKPDTEQVFKALKDFQRRTVEYVFRRMYLDPDLTRRFLVADEVGLGKTLVARGLIAKTVDYLWDRVERIDVVYICSNADIARQNIARLYIADKHDFTPPSRLTLLPLHLHSLKDGRRLNFVAFTPGTSFDLKSSCGTGWERALLFQVLRKHWEFSGRAPYNVFSVYMEPDNFISYCKSMAKEKIEEEVAEAFLKNMDEQEKIDKSAGRSGLRQRIEKLCGAFCRSDSRFTEDDVEERNIVIGELRRQMAFTCLNWLEPDLIIMDEFQRFKHLLDSGTEAGELAQRLFEYSDEHSAARVMLLSATPYKMYTLNDEQEGDSHYDDFLDTLKFLLNDPGRIAAVDRLLDAYAKELHRLGSGGLETLVRIKSELETQMRRVMVRTERLSNSKDRNGMLREILSPAMAPEVMDIEHYLGQAKIGSCLGCGSLVDYWKSSPYLLNFMEEYEVKRAFRNGTGSNTVPVVRQQLLDAPEILLSHADLKRYRAIDPFNARLRGLVRDVIDSGAWKLLWMPPSLPYYPLFNEFAQPAASKITKRLVFSCWHVVPKAIAALVSYEAERRCHLLQNPKAINTPEERKKKRPLLRFAISDGRLTGMPVLGLIYPATHLARQTDPLFLAKEKASAEGEMLSFADLFEAAKMRVRSMLGDIHVTTPPGSPVDENWYWAAPVLIDLARQAESTARWLDQGDLPQIWAGKEDGEELDRESRWNDHVAAMKSLCKDFQAGKLILGRQPDDLVDVLAQLGMSGPGCCCLRSLWRFGFPNYDLESRNAAAAMAYAFLTLFNLPESMAIIRGPREGEKAREPYWVQMLDYSAAGCLQSVLDEYVHVLRESLGRIDSPPDKTLADVAQAVSSVLRLRTSRVSYDHVIAKPRSRVKLVSQSMRVRYAMRFGKQESDDGGKPTREDIVRAAFNSPFWPFVMATTSIGQEGLDFHQYCHAIVHWNLPDNPVDLEQREGRIHRYKGHAIRKNLAQKHRLAMTEGPDPWTAMFLKARGECAPGTSEIEPFWVLTVEGGAYIERHVPAMPASKDEIRLARLKKAVFLYRLAFGQLRQADLVDFLGSRLDVQQAEKLSHEILLNLEPPAVK
ncbi:MAG: helicase-related protein [PVC group bacterium]